MTGGFFFDGHSSKDLGIYIVGINGAEDMMPLFGGQSYVSQDVIGHDFESFIKTKKDNIKFTLYFSLYEADGDESFDTNKLYAVGKFFARSIPFEFKVAENMLKVIYIVPTSSIELVQFEKMKGYFQVSFQATMPYWMTPVDVKEFNLTTEPENSTFSVFNGRNIQDKYGNYDIYPKIEIQFGTKTVADFVLSNDIRQIIIKNFLADDHVTMQHRMISSGKDSNHIFSKWNKIPFCLTEGNNMLSVNNDCTVKIHLQYPVFY